MTEYLQPDRPSKRRGRPRGSRNQSHKPATTTVSVRAEEADARRITGLMAEGWLINPRLTHAQIVLQALEEYVASRRPNRNISVNNNIRTDDLGRHRYHDPLIQQQWDKFAAERNTRRAELDRELKRIAGGGDLRWK